MVGKINITHYYIDKYNNFDENVFIKVIFISKFDSEKYTQISSVGAAVYRQVM